MAAGKKTDWVYDELLCFLGNPFFQVPVLTFMEAHCLIFDPSVDDSPEYKKVHAGYSKVVMKLLEAFMKDSGLTQDEVIKALSDMNAKKDLREIFQGLFEQVLAMDDFGIFVRLMTQKNIELQQQALLLIIQTTGCLPQSLQEGGPAPPLPSKSAEAPESEDEIMRRVLEKSKREYEEEQKRKSKVETKDKEQVEALLVVSKAEVSHLENQKQLEQERLNLAMANLTTHESLLEQRDDKSKAMPKITRAPSPKAAAPKFIPPQVPKVPTQQKPVLKHPEAPQVTVTGTGTPSISQTSLGPGLMSKTALPNISSKDAAANWLKSAQDEATSGSAHANAVQAAAAALSKLSSEELKKRQEYLRQQRDKLVEMKKKEREKQLLEAEKDQPGRPMSARAARQTLQADKTKEEPKVSAEDQKKLEMRRAIANKLKAELMGSQ